MFCLHTAIPTTSFCGFGTAIPTSFYIFLNTCLCAFFNAQYSTLKDIAFAGFFQNSANRSVIIAPIPAPFRDGNTEVGRGMSIIIFEVGGVSPKIS